MPRKPASAEPSEENLRRWYVEEGKSIDAIAARTRTNYSLVWRLLKRHGIQRRPRGRAKVAQLTAEQLERKLLQVYRRKKGPRTVAALAESLGVSRQHLTRVLKEKRVSPWEVRRRVAQGSR